MMRILKLCTFGFVVLMLFANCNAAPAIETYQMGPYTVGGEGITEAEAIADANFLMLQELLSIEAGLPPNHVLLDYEIIWEGFSDPLIYQITFTVTIWDQSPPGPPMR